MSEYIEWLKSIPSLEDLKNFLQYEWQIPEREFPEIVIEAMSYFENMYNKDKGYPYSFNDWLEDIYKSTLKNK